MDALLWINEFSPGKNEFTTSNKVSLFYYFYHLLINNSIKLLQSEEEIKRFTLEDDLSELKRSLFILNKGQQIQKHAVNAPSLYIQLIIFKIYTNLHRILLENGAFEKLAPIIQVNL